jgi:hypothetical protein
LKIIRRVFCALLLGPAFGAHADYSWELAGVFDHTERSADFRRLSTSEFDTDQVSLSATHYFDPVAAGSGPPALAAFFDPRTQLSVAAGEEDTTDRFFGGPNSFVDTQGKEEVSHYSLRGLYLFPKSKWYAGGRYARQDGERRFGSSSISTTGSGARSDDLQGYALFVGKYFGMSATRLELSLEQSTAETELASTTCTTFIGGCSTFNFSGEETSDTPRLAVMHVGRVRSATYALIGDISEERLRDAMFDFDPARTYFVGAELYPVSTIGVRFGYESFESPAFDQEPSASAPAGFFGATSVSISLSRARIATTTIPSPTTTRGPRIAQRCV